MIRLANFVTSLMEQRVTAKRYGKFAQPFKWGVHCIVRRSFKTIWCVIAAGCRYEGLITFKDLLRIINE